MAGSGVYQEMSSVINHPWILFFFFQLRILIKIFSVILTHEVFKYFITNDLIFFSFFRQFFTFHLGCVTSYHLFSTYIYQEKLSWHYLINHDHTRFPAHFSSCVLKLNVFLCLDMLIFILRLGKKSCVPQIFAFCNINLPL